MKVSCLPLRTTNVLEADSRRRWRPGPIRHQTRREVCPTHMRYSSTRERANGSVPSSKSRTRRFAAARKHEPFWRRDHKHGEQRPGDLVFEQICGACTRQQVFDDHLTSEIRQGVYRGVDDGPGSPDAETAPPSSPGAMATDWRIVLFNHSVIQCAWAAEGRRGIRACARGAPAPAIGLHAARTGRWQCDFHPPATLRVP